MERRQLGSGPWVSAIGMGCMGLSQGYGPASDAESVRAIHQALEAGVTLLDTAMSYGQGHNEELVGRALAGWAGASGSPGPGGTAGTVAVATKFGIVRRRRGVTLDGRPEHVRGYCETSLRRLGRDVIDLYYLHRVDPAVPVADSVGAMAELVRAGKVRHLGLSEATPEQLAQAVAVHPIAAVQFEWSLLWRGPETSIVPAARQLGIGLVPYSPLGRGLLTATLTSADIASSDFRRSDPRFSGGALDRNLAQVAALRGVADGLGITPGQLALAWLLAQGDDVVPIPGSRHPVRIAENAAAAGVRLSPADLARLEAVVPRAAWAGDRRSFAAPATTRSAGGG
jgi:aryl-alcohol dehydrogenase-like predicted oxidoreductase